MKGLDAQNYLSVRVTDNMLRAGFVSCDELIANNTR